MQPSEFWGADTWTVMDAYEGYAMSKGVEIDGAGRVTRDEVEELQQMMEEYDRRR